MVTPVDSFVTPGDIRRALGEPQHRVDNVLATRGHIQPLRRVGIVRAYAKEAVEQVRLELEQIDSKRVCRVS